LLDGERVSFTGRWHSTSDAILLPKPVGRPTLMVGSTGPRVLAATLPHVDVWNTWYDLFANTPEGFARERRTIDGACERAGRDPATLERSACVLVRFPGGAGERPDEPGIEPVDPSELRGELDTFAEAGADEVILVCDPITEGSIRALGAAVAD
jgi:alkanesulfonate monooxygenase SsuD/methylene tetrahydromethanopterin reductase-like flavin-dependent oxidoreductase (luciferase family)